LSETLLNPKIHAFSNREFGRSKSEGPDREFAGLMKLLRLPEELTVKLALESKKIVQSSTFRWLHFPKMGRGRVRVDSKSFLQA
jgi:hypothetical protein